MRRIETIAIVRDDGTLTIAVPPDIRPGTHSVVIEIDEHSSEPEHSDHSAWLTFVHETAGAWQGDFERPSQGVYDVRKDFECQEGQWSLHA